MMKHEQPNTQIDSRAKELLESSLVWDNVWPVDLPCDEDAGNDWEKLDRFAAAGINVLGVTLAGDNHDASEALRLTAWARRHLQARSDQVSLAHTMDDIATARKAGKLSVVLQFEGTRCFERDLGLIEVFYALGVRQTILAFNNANCTGAGCAEAVDGGLTAYGRRFIKEAERVGMLIDLSHVGRKTSLDALEVAEKPMLFTHSNANTVHRSFRNIDDDQARAAARTGGLVGISGSSEYLGDHQCRTETLFRHLDHYVQLLGAEHVCIGLDVVFEAEPLSRWARSRPDEWPMAQDPDWPGFNYAVPEQLTELVGLMLTHGYPDKGIQGILGENYVRVCKQVWR
jgi:membrane dipeptidase